jgi:hypothetical protein
VLRISQPVAPTSLRLSQRLVHMTALHQRAYRVKITSLRPRTGTAAGVKVREISHVSKRTSYYWTNLL